MGFRSRMIIEVLAAAGCLLFRLFACRGREFDVNSIPLSKYYVASRLVPIEAIADG